MSSRRRGNSIFSILVNEVVIEGVEEVRHAGFLHFSSHFKAIQMNRLGVDNLVFCTLSYEEGGNLIRSITAEEVRASI